jgi:hypothetical protein
MNKTDGRDDISETIEALQDRAEGPLYSVVEFDPGQFDILHLADETSAMYPDEEAMVEHFSEIHEYVNIDFAERELFSDELLPGAGSVTYMTTSLDAVKVVRVYDGQRGVFLAVNPDERVVPLAEIVESRLL